MLKGHYIYNTSFDEVTEIEVTDSEYIWAGELNILYGKDDGKFYGVHLSDKKFDKLSKEVAQDREVLRQINNDWDISSLVRNKIERDNFEKIVELSNKSFLINGA